MISYVGDTHVLGSGRYKFSFYTGDNPITVDDYILIEFEANLIDY